MSFSVWSDFPNAAGIPRQLDNVPFNLDRVAPLVLIWVKAVAEAGAVPAVEGGAETGLTATLRKGQRDLPIFFDELNDALEAHGEEYGPLAGAMRAVAEKKEAEVYQLAQAR